MAVVVAAFAFPDDDVRKGVVADDDDDVIDLRPEGVAPMAPSAASVLAAIEKLG